jgi:uncharacterized DUF497 family protein
VSKEKQLRFNWDEKKAKANLQKHKVSFEDAQTVFYDDYSRLIPDPDHSDDEDRFILLGMSEHLHILVVCHCYRENDSVIRLISARKANKHERAYYEENIK